jgi:hypothetical protein
LNTGERSNKKAQTWSVDLVLGVVIFLLVIVVIYSLIASRPARDNQLRDDADRIYSKLSNGSTGSDNVPKVLNGNSISKEDLAKLYGQNYDELKAELGIKGDFCIIVVTDQNGIINTTNGSSIGNKKDIVIGDKIYCGE